jgi:hypothetical protein
MVRRNMIRLETLVGEAMIPRLGDLARLRALVFRDWPYLYDAKPSAPDGYRTDTAHQAGAALVVALEGERCVGCATVFLLSGESEAVQAPFHAAGLDVARYAYFGESVLERGYRGRGLGVGFCAAREAHARSLPGVSFATFCRVERPDDHPLRPAEDEKLDGFWRRRGYGETALECRFHWKQVDSADKVENVMRFWVKPL